MGVFKRAIDSLQGCDRPTLHLVSYFKSQLPQMLDDIKFAPAALKQNMRAVIAELKANISNKFVPDVIHEVAYLLHSLSKVVAADQDGKALELLEKDGLLTHLFGDETAFRVCTRCSRTVVHFSSEKGSLSGTKNLNRHLEVCTGADTNRKRRRTLDEFLTVAPDRLTKCRVTEGCVRACDNDGRPYQSFASESMKAVLEILLDIGKRNPQTRALGPRCAVTDSIVGP
ncbi:uncharacterized protein PHALS_11310 [Plasmopara halstedii]|uniref:BED-type domain-containing protein n=1 Tax=Plasmopara halstedii TaxID=4781 RepID=A0A0P1AK08_PLAHL|nr:uncharacterized protein PHALS_11310 [Plasmopara halstedii]CEG41146.1 hypothetical protein PHALS_11310 [Plasmopara halstedii]|eukprot:XP_024577515.1 hypothetical protein PHALS_11310 [Plasmopara halstedii]